jgi:hypothetical protein
MRPRSIFGVVIAALSALALTASAGAAGINTRTPFTELFDNPCNGEAFIASGFVHITSDFRVGLDGSLHDRYHLNMEGMTAKTVVGGVKYVVQEEWNVGQNASDDHSTMHHIQKLHFVRAREDGTVLLGGDDFYFYVHLHMTLNANGTPTAFTMKGSDPDDPCH